MLIQKDYEKLLELFNKHKVRYCIIGAYAVAFHVLPRYSKDMDILVEPSLENGEKIVKALKDFGFGSLKLKKENFARKSAVIQLGYEPVRVDIVTSVDGRDFKTVWKNKKFGRYGKEKVFFIGLVDLVANKKATNRPIDRFDLEALLKAKIKKSTKKP